MDFSNERYVRLYTRDTTTWLLLEFEGQTVLMHMLRKATRAGVIDLAGREPWQAPVLHCRIPGDFARKGMEACLREGVIVHEAESDRLVFPRYIEANEATQSGAQRVREHRARSEELKRNVTPSSNEPLQDRNGEKRAVTSGNSVPCRTVPYQEELRSTPPAGAREEQGSFQVGHDFMHTATGRPYLQEWRRDLELIGAKPAAERAIVLARIQADPWCKGNTAVDPTHVLKQWPKYLKPPNRDPVVRAASGGGKYAGPSEVAKPEDYAVKGEIKW